MFTLKIGFLIFTIFIMSSLTVAVKTTNTAPMPTCNPPEMRQCKPSEETLEKVAQITTEEERINTVIERSEQGMRRVMMLEQAEEEAIATGEARTGYCQRWNQPWKRGPCTLGDQCPYLHEAWPVGFRANKLTRICRLFGITRNELLEILINHGLIENKGHKTAKIAAAQKIPLEVLKDVLSYYHMAVTPVQPTSHYPRIVAPSTSASSTGPRENSNAENSYRENSDADSS